MHSQIEVSADKLYTQLNDLRSTLKQWDLQTFTVKELSSTIDMYGQIDKEFEVQEFFPLYK